MAEPKPEYKPAPVRRMTFVEVPRAVYAQYQFTPWQELLAAAAAGRDGLQVVEDNYFASTLRKDEYALLREGVNGGTFLFRQNWISDDAIFYAHYL
jgi:hypothetical protein